MRGIWLIEKRILLLPPPPMLPLLPLLPLPPPPLLL